MYAHCRAHKRAETRPGRHAQNRARREHSSCTGVYNVIFFPHGWALSTSHTACV
jgi:hypothetical protein